MQLENADAGVGGKPHREGGLPQKLEPGHKNYGGATKVCHRPQESTREHMIQIQMQIQIQIQMQIPLAALMMMIKLTISRNTVMMMIMMMMMMFVGVVDHLQPSMMMTTSLNMIVMMMMVMLVMLVKFVGVVDHLRDLLCLWPLPPAACAGWQPLVSSS